MFEAESFYYGMQYQLFSLLTHLFFQNCSYERIFSIMVLKDVYGA